MRQTSVIRRLVFVAIALIQLGAPTLVAVADARIDARSGVADRVHIEDHSRRVCHAVHPDKCSLCQFLSHFAPQRAVAPTVPVSAAGCSVAYEAAHLLPSSLARALKRTRAPPVA